MLFNALILVLNVLTTVAGTLLDSVLFEQTLFKWLGHMLEQTHSKCCSSSVRRSVVRTTFVRRSVVRTTFVGTNFVRATFVRTTILRTTVLITTVCF